ncbi:threonine-phosphate decarboxylase CobD [Novosphingobium huizhouense]|uniref:threonine-phosphate decarboxylase CobD n=1 Tax=Novosphingobium huizhouense TaxID=2866625 RepID=UPI001CD8234B|nr:threonine-phosphate decarboxylase CobD [Novosphingobium huizhouense]
MTADFVHHGGRLGAACARFGGEPSAWLDLSTGINPLPWRAPGDLSIDWHRLPEPAELEALETVAARHFGCDRAHCVAVAGSESALRLIGRILELPGLYRPPCYGTYRTAFARAEPCLSLDALPGRATALVLGHPNNPDGEALGTDRLHAVLAHQERHGGWLILDEAFADCDPRASLAPLVDAERRLIVLRSFGKFFGLAGLRLGFVVAPPLLAAALRALLGDWPVHSAAIRLGRAAYADRAWIEQAQRQLAASAARLDAMLARRGFPTRGSCPLFRLIVTPQAPALFDRLARRRILTRPFADRPDLLRIGLPANRAARDRLERALG